MGTRNFSKKRQRILDAIKETKTHPSARWVYDTLKEEIPDLSLGTVYRNIALFKEQGLIISVTNIDGEEHIDGDTSPHAHFVCKGCGEIFDIFPKEGEGKENSCPLEGFTCDSAVLTYFGRCKSCNSTDAN